MTILNEIQEYALAIAESLQRGGLYITITVTTRSNVHGEPIFIECEAFNSRHSTTVNVYQLQHIHTDMRKRAVQQLVREPVMRLIQHLLGEAFHV